MVQVDWNLEGELGGWVNPQNKWTCPMYTSMSRSKKSQCRACREAGHRVFRMKKVVVVTLLQTITSELRTLTCFGVSQAVFYLG